MKKYLVIRTTHGFQGRLWREGTEAEFDDDVVPPRHFQLMDGGVKHKKVVEDLEEKEVALSQIAKKVVKPMPVAGIELKGQKKVGEVKKVEAKDDF